MNSQWQSRLAPFGRRKHSPGSVGTPPDVVTSAVTIAATVLFVAIAGTVFATMIAQYHNGQTGAAHPLLAALLLNIAVILIGWRRHRDLFDELQARIDGEQRATDLALRDPLTGLFNRRSFTEQAAGLLRGAPSEGSAVAVMIIDLDGFKSVNDVHGHPVGDAVLRTVSDVIADCAGPHAIAARLGGDEFACALPFDPGDGATVDAIAERLTARLAQPICADGLQLHIGASTGLARSDMVAGGVDALMRSADIAMYSAKRGGRGGFAWFDQSMERAAADRAELEAGLRAAIPSGDIVPYFEQQVDLRTGRLVGLEVLARWDHPKRGLIAPDDFIGVAEDIGVIAELSLSIMRQAFEAARDWDPALTLSVNLSPVQLKDPWIAQHIVKLLMETRFPARRLEVEITEKALFSNLALAHSIASTLKSHGVQLALDDFGTGFSSLAHLRALPFDRIKVDRSFVSAINSDTESAAIVQALIGLGDNLQLPVTAEGIEDGQIEERLRRLGCARGQGHFYGRPMNAANTRRLLAERRLLTMPVRRTPVPLSGTPRLAC